MGDTQADRRGEHHHVHHQIQCGGHVHQRGERGVAVRDEHEQQCEYGDDDALRQQNALLHAGGIALLQHGRHQAGACCGKQAT